MKAEVGRVGKTRSEPADKDDPYKSDLLEQQLVEKYEKMLLKGEK